jgi:predicted small secreted protein
MMKKLCAALLALILLASVLAGCQKTPETPVVIGKDTEQLIDSAKSDTGGKTLAQMLNAPNRMELSATSGKGDVTVNANADIVIPPVDAVSITRVKERAFTQEEADRLLEYFIGDKAFNNRYAAGFDADVQQLLELKEALARETDPAKRAELQASIEKFAPAGITDDGGPEEVKPAAKLFTPEADGGGSIAGYSSDSDAHYYLLIQNNPKDHRYSTFFSKASKGYALGSGMYRYEWDKQFVAKLGIDSAVLETELLLSKDAAQQKATDALAAFGLDGMVLSACDEVWGGVFLQGGTADSQGHHAYKLEYVREIGGVPITRADNDIFEGQISDSESTDKDKVSVGFSVEQVQFIIDDTGIIQFIWQSPYETVETVTQSSMVKSFDEIEGIFSKMILITNAYQGDDEVRLSIAVTKAQFGLMRVAVKNDNDSFLLIPVWDFFGTTTVEASGGTGGDQNIYLSRLTINAIDGSVIDRSLGY